MAVGHVFDGAASAGGFPAGHCDLAPVVTPVETVVEPPVEATVEEPAEVASNVPTPQEEAPKVQEEVTHE